MLELKITFITYLIHFIYHILNKFFLLYEKHKKTNVFLYYQAIIHLNLKLYLKHIFRKISEIHISSYNHKLLVL
jgi:hypothetical protein